MQDIEQLQLAKNSKILYNLLEIKIFDISQALQIIGHKLTINQIKQALQKQHNIFSQTQTIFEELKVKKLYEIMKLCSQNFISISSVLLDNLSKIVKGQTNSINIQIQEKSQVIKEKFQKISLKNTKQVKINQNNQHYQKKYNNEEQPQKSQIPDQNGNNNDDDQKTRRYNKFGGIYLYNESYMRGIEYPQRGLGDIFRRKNKKINHKQLLKQLIMKELNNQTDVEKIDQNDQVAKFIKVGKNKHQIYYHIEYQKDLESISLFLKQSQDEAFKFLKETKNLKQARADQNLVINYHELMQALALKKKQDFTNVQQKLKQVIQKLKKQSNMFQDEILRKQYKMQELQKKLLKKQTKQIGVQTLDNKKKTNKLDGSYDQIDQHKIVVETLKKNLQRNQREILLMATEIKIIQQKSKKKQMQSIVQVQEIQKLRRSLREQKQRFQSTILKFQQNQIQNFFDHTLQSQQIQQNQQNSNDLLQSSDPSRGTRKKRTKLTMTGLAGEGLYRTAENKNQNLSSFAEYKSSDENNNINVLDDIKSNNISQKVKGFLSNDNLKSDERKNSVDRVLQKNESNHNLDRQNQQNYPKDNQQYEKSINHNQKVKSECNLLINSTGNNLKLNQTNLTNSTNNSIKNFYSSLVVKNAQSLYNYLFSQSEMIIPVAKKDREEQVELIKQIIQRFDQIKLNEKLKKIKTFMGQIQGLGYIKQQSNNNSFQVSQYDQLEDKEYELRSSRKSEKSRHFKKSQRRIEFQDGLYQEQQRSTYKNSSSRKCIKSKRSIGQSSSKLLKSSKRIENNKKDDGVFSKDFFNKLHEKLKIAGKNFNYSKKQFIQICEMIDSAESEQNSAKRSQQEDQFSIERRTRKQTSTEKNQQRDLQGILQRFRKISIEQKEEKIPYVINKINIGRQGQSEKRHSEKVDEGENKQNVLFQQSSLNKPNIIDVNQRKSSLVNQISVTNNDGNSEQEKSQKHKLIKEVMKIIFKRSKNVASISLLKEIMANSDLSLTEILQVKQILTKLKDAELEKVLTEGPLHVHEKNHQQTCEKKECCSHLHKFKAFIEKLKENEKFKTRKSRKESFEISVFNIDGRSSQQNFHRNSFSQSKHSENSPVTTDATQMNNNGKRSLHESFSESAFKNFEGKMDSKLKKQVISVYIESKQKKNQPFLPQLTRKGIRT